LNIKVDQDLKQAVDAIFGRLGLTTSAGVTVYLRQVVATRSIPFSLALPPDDEDDAMQTTRRLSRSALNLEG
jgi:addiction module RelB/DinJ family antitoxin